MVRRNDIKLVDDIVRRVGLTEDQRELLHEEFRHYGRLTYREIIELARQIKRDFPNK